MQAAQGATRKRTGRYVDEERRRPAPQIRRAATGEVMRCALAMRRRVTRGPGVCQQARVGRARSTGRAACGFRRPRIYGCANIIRSGGYASTVVHRPTAGPRGRSGLPCSRGPDARPHPPPPARRGSLRRGPRLGVAGPATDGLPPPRVSSPGRARAGRAAGTVELLQALAARHRVSPEDPRRPRGSRVRPEPRRQGRAARAAADWRLLSTARPSAERSSQWASPLVRVRRRDGPMARPPLPAGWWRRASGPRSCSPP